MDWFKNSEKRNQIIELVRLIICCIITGFIVAAILDYDIYKGIYTSVFIFICYYSFEILNDKSFWKNTEMEDGIIITKKFAVILTSCLILLLLTTLITSIIFYSLKVDYCKKNKFYYSQMRCSLQEADHSIRDNYDASSYDNGNDY